MEGSEPIGGPSPKNTFTTIAPGDPGRLNGLWTLLCFIARFRLSIHLFIAILASEAARLSLQVAFPPTFGEAQALVQGREDEKRKAAARRDKHKQRPSKSKDAVFDNSFPGAVPGAEANNTAFWLATEVRGTHNTFLLSAAGHSLCRHMH